MTGGRSWGGGGVVNEGFYCTVNCSWFQESKMIVKLTYFGVEFECVINTCRGRLKHSHPVSNSGTKVSQLYYH